MTRTYRIRLFALLPTAESSPNRVIPPRDTHDQSHDHPNFESLQFLLAPLQTALTDANTGCPLDRVALRNHALRKRRHVCWKLSSGRIHNHLPQARICGQRSRCAIDHHDFSAGRLGSQGTHHCSSDLARPAHYQDAKCQFLAPLRRTGKILDQAIRYEKRSRGGQCSDSEDPRMVAFSVAFVQMMASSRLSEF
jgi:hypothetical protein